MTIIRALARAIPGAVFGALFGVLLLVVGVPIRLFAALVVRQPVSLDGFSVERLLIVILIYCLGFSIAGGALSALWPLRDSRPGAYFLGYLGAGIVSAMLGGLVMWLEQDQDLRKHVITLCIMTITFGTAAGYKIHHWETAQETLNKLQRRRSD